MLILSEQFCYQCIIFLLSLVENENQGYLTHRRNRPTKAQRQRGKAKLARKFKYLQQQLHDILPPQEKYARVIGLTKIPIKEISYPEASEFALEPVESVDCSHGVKKIHCNTCINNFSKKF